jgi:hypothetical protein
MNKYGPNSPQVELFIERLKTLTIEEAKEIQLVRNEIYADAAWDAARFAAWDAVWNATQDAQAIVVMDLITEEQFQILTEPFAEILAELGIAWEGK